MIADVLIAFSGSRAEIGPYIVFQPPMKILCHCETSRRGVNAFIEAR
jgi:hypothetical protein